jgi:hypothetical protein
LKIELKNQTQAFTACVFFTLVIPAQAGISFMPAAPASLLSAAAQYYPAAAD